MPATRQGQRGQALPIIALAGTVLIGATALAVDVSLNTHARRTLQNITDTAALAGAQDLPASVQQGNRQTAALAALDVVDKQLGQPAAALSDIGTGSGNDCNPGVNHCHVVFAAGAYAGTIDTPPVRAHDTAYDVDGYLEVDIVHTSRNNIGQAIGQGTSTESGHSVAYHFAAGQALGAALFVNTYVATGNDGELVEGNVYAQRFVNPQSGGQAGFCAGNGGRIVLGEPQIGLNPDTPYDQRNNKGQADILPNTAQFIQTLPNCNPLNSPTQLNTTGSGTVNQTVASPTSCANAIPGMPMSAQYSPAAGTPTPPGVGTCVANPALPAPTANFQEPTHSTTPVYGCNSPANGGGWYECDSSNASALVVGSGAMPPGVYVVNHGSGNNCGPPSCYDVDFNRVTATAHGVTIILMNGATLGVERGASVTIDPTTSPPCQRVVDVDCTYPIYSGAGSSSQLFVKDVGSTLSLYGTLYMVAGTVNCDSNAFFQIVQGQAIVGTWNVQSGNHENPVVTFDAGVVAPQTEILRLAE